MFKVPKVKEEEEKQDAEQLQIILRNIDYCKESDSKIVTENFSKIKAKMMAFFF